MQRIGQNGGLCHGEQKANSYNSRKYSLKTLLLYSVHTNSTSDGADQHKSKKRNCHRQINHSELKVIIAESE